jgi:hypothetical protein
MDDWPPGLDPPSSEDEPEDAAVDVVDPLNAG